MLCQIKAEISRKTYFIFFLCLLNNVKKGFGTLFILFESRTRIRGINGSESEKKKYNNKSKYFDKNAVN